MLIFSATNHWVFQVCLIVLHCVCQFIHCSLKDDSICLLPYFLLHYSFSYLPLGKAFFPSSHRGRLLNSLEKNFLAISHHICHVLLQDAPTFYFVSTACVNKLSMPSISPNYFPLGTDPVCLSSSTEGHHPDISPVWHRLFFFIQSFPPT